MSARGRWLTAGGVAAVLGCIAGMAAAQNAPAPATRHFELPPLESMQETRDRPLFSPTRKPPAVIAAPEAPPPIVESVSLPFDLTGIALGGDAPIAILHNKTTNEEVRLRQGDKIETWQLEQVSDHYILLRGDRRRVRVWLVSNAKPPGVDVRQVDGAAEENSADALPTGEVDQEVVPAAAVPSAGAIPPPVTRRLPPRPPGAPRAGPVPRPGPFPPPQANRAQRRN